MSIVNMLILLITNFRYYFFNELVNYFTYYIIAIIVNDEDRLSYVIKSKLQKKPFRSLSIARIIRKAFSEFTLV